MAIPPVNQPRTLQRSTRYFTGSGWKETSVSSKSTGNVLTGNAPMANSIIAGFDTQEVAIPIGAIAPGAAANVTSTVTFPNIAKLTPQIADGMQFHVDMVHIDGVPASCCIQKWNIQPRAQQTAGGPDIIPNEGFPTIHLSSGIAKGITYRSFQALVNVQIINTGAVNSPAGTIVVHLSAKLINAPG
jgi:hypothetical protein